MRLSSLKIRELFAPVYSSACLDAGVSMVELANCLEHIRERIEKGDEYGCWDQIKLERKQLDKPPLINLLSELKTNYYSAIAKSVIDTVKKVCETDVNEAFAMWKKEYISSLLGWRNDVYGLLCDTSFNFTENQKLEINKFKKLNHYILDSAWVEAYPYFCELCNDDKLTNVERCSFEITAAEIKLFWMQEYKQTINHIEKAKILYPGNYKVLRIYGNYYSKLSEYEKAREYFLDAISGQPDDLITYLSMGDSYKSESNWTVAEQWYTDALNLNFLNTDTYSRLICLYAESNKLNERITEIDLIIQKISVIEPNAVYSNSLYNIYRDIAYAWSISNNYPKSVEWYQKAIDLKPDLSSGRIDLGIVMANNGDQKEAIEIFNQIVKKDSENYNARLGIATTLEKSNQTQEAIMSYDDCIKIRPEWADRIYNSKGVLYHNLSEYEKAKKLFKLAIEKRDDEPVYYDNLLDAMENLNESGETEKLLLEIIKLRPNDPVIQNKTGLYYYKNNMPEKAIPFYEEALKLNPKYNIYYANLGVAYEYMKEYDKAERFYLKANDINEDQNTLNKLGRIYYLRGLEGDNEKAINFFKKAIELNKNSSELFENLGLAYEKNNLMDEAEETFKMAASLEHASGNYLNRLGVFYFKKGDYSKAFEYYQKALDREKNNTVYLENLALLYENTNESDKAVKTYEKILTVNNTDHYIRARLALVQMNQKNYHESEKNILKSLEQDPENIIYMQYLGAIYEYEGLNEKALAFYEGVLSKHPDDEYFNNRTGVLLYRTGIKENILKSSDYYQKAIKTNNKDGVYYLNLGLALKDLNQFKEAEQSYFKAIELEPGNAEYQNFLGVLYYQFGENEKAVESYKKAILLNSNQGVYYQNLGLAYGKLNKNKESEQSYFKAIELEPGNAEYQNNLGVLYYQIGRNEKAVESYKKAILLNSSMGVYYQNLGLAYEKLNKNKEAEQAYFKSIELEPGNAEYQNKLGVLYYQVGENEKAVESYKKAILLNSNVGLYYQNLGLAYGKLNKNKEAEQAYLKSIELEPGNAEYQNLLGVLYYQIGENENAVESYKKAILLNSSPGVYYQNLGLAYEKLYKNKEAEQAYLKSIELEPGNAEYLNLLGVLYYKIGENEKAAESYKKAILLNNNLGVYYQNLGLAYEKLNKIREAEQVYLRSVEIDAGNDRLLNIVGMFYFEKLNDYKKAIELFEKAGKINPGEPNYYLNIGDAYTVLKNKKKASVAYERAGELSKLNAPGS